MTEITEAVKYVGAAARLLRQPPLDNVELEESVALKLADGIDALLSEIARLQEEVKGLRAALRFCQAEAIEGSNDLDDPITAKWDCSAPNLPIITRNVARFVDIYNAGKAVIGEYEMTDAELEEFRLKVATLQGQQS